MPFTSGELEMSAALIAALLATMVATSFLSGIFGMAGGMILMGLLLALLPLPAAMALHAVAQIASNGWRGVLWIGHVRWRAAGAYIIGCLFAVLAWTLVRYVPSKPTALLALGTTPFLLHLLPERFKPDPENLLHGTIYGTACMSLMLLTGVAGPLVDRYFLGGNLSRKEIVATKAVCQIFGHGTKLVYFGGLIEQAASVEPWLAASVIIASMVGTVLARPILERLSDASYRVWAARLITTIACVYLGQGVYLLATTNL
jgi:uncharacterized membrane protein YfcA